jgi:hypothetical protein
VKNSDALVAINVAATVVVDDDGEIIEPMMAGKKDGLPDRAFVALAIAQQRNDAMPGSGESGSIRHATGYGKPVPERAGGDFHTGHFVRDMPAQV